jgi:hypothetical protein
MKITIDELTRLAFLWAEQDRAALADAWPKGSPERAEAREMASRLKAYRTKRWGLTQMEVLLSKAKPRSIFA